MSECLNIFAAGCRINVKEHDGSNEILYSTTQKSKPYSCKLAYNIQGYKILDLIKYCASHL